MLLAKAFFVFFVVSACSCWYYHHYGYYNPYDGYFRTPYSYFRRQNSNCQKWCYSYTTPHIHCCVYKERPNTCPYTTIHCTVPLASGFTSHFRCNGDFDCPVGYKCCHDSCFSHKICKSHNIEWLRWNMYSHGYNHHPFSAAAAIPSPKETEDNTGSINISLSSSIPSNIFIETSTEVVDIYTSHSPHIMESEVTAEEIANTDTDTETETSVSAQLENKTTTEIIFYTGTDETTITSDSSELENEATTEDVTDITRSTEETSPASTTETSSTTQNTFGVLFSLFGKKETETKEIAVEKSVDIKETEVNGKNETDTNKRPDDESSGAGPVIEGSGNELEGKEAESVDKEGSGSDDDEEDVNTFVNDEDIGRKRRSNNGNTKQKEKGNFFIVDTDEDDNGTENNDPFFL